LASTTGPRRYARYVYTKLDRPSPYCQMTTELDGGLDTFVLPGDVLRKPVANSRRISPITAISTECFYLGVHTIGWSMRNR